LEHDIIEKEPSPILFKNQDTKIIPEEKSVNSSIHSTGVKNKVNNDISRQECNLNGKQHLNLL